MILKLLVLAAVIWAVYFFFFKKKSVSAIKTDKNEASSMVECVKCSTYISVDDAIVSNGRYYCSKECVKD